MREGGSRYRFGCIKGVVRERGKTHKFTQIRNKLRNSNGERGNSL